METLLGTKNSSVIPNQYGVRQDGVQSAKVLEVHFKVSLADPRSAVVLARNFARMGSLCTEYLVTSIGKGRSGSSTPPGSNDEAKWMPCGRDDRWPSHRDGWLVTFCSRSVRAWTSRVLGRHPVLLVV